MPSFSIADASARMPSPEVFSERKSSSMMTMGKRKRSMARGPRVVRAWRTGNDVGTGREPGGAGTRKRGGKPAKGEV